MNQASVLRIVLMMIWPVIDLSVAQAQGAQLAARSVYSNLTQPPCHTFSVQTEGASSAQICAGMFGYKLLLLDSDGRMSVTLIDAQGKQHPLDFWKTVTPHFSSVGHRAEWRVAGTKAHAQPVGIIFSLAVKDDPDSNVDTSYLVVAKLDHDSTCVVDVIREGKTAIETARRTADDAALKSCRTL